MSTMDWLAFARKQPNTPWMLNLVGLANMCREEDEPRLGPEGFVILGKDLARLSERLGLANSGDDEARTGAGAYVNEADYFEPNWQNAFWGENYRRLLEVKQEYDPRGLFTCHHCVGSERLSSD